MPQLNANAFTTRVPMAFWSQDNPALSVVGANALVNNPNMFYVQPGNVGKVELGINGATMWRGNIEFAPFAVQMQWDLLGYNDYTSLAALGGYYIDLVTFRNTGYYGKIMFDGPKSAKPRSTDIIGVTATMYVLTPSDYGGANPVTRLDPPATISISEQPGGDIPAGTTVYYWLTFKSLLGETTPYFSQTITNPYPGGKIMISWLWPNSAYCTGASLYVGVTNDPTQSKLICEAINGDTPTWTDYVGFNGAIINQQPPAINTAYRGLWQGGIWENEYP